MDYYNVNDIQKITGEGQGKCYEIIRELNKAFKSKYPESVSIQGKIPKWFFQETMRNKKEVYKEELEEL